jgi:hypothetical protein
MNQANKILDERSEIFTDSYSKPHGDEVDFDLLKPNGNFTYHEV